MFDKIYDYKLTEEGEDYFVPITYPNVKEDMYLISTRGECYNPKTDTILKGDINKDGYRVYRLRKTDIDGKRVDGRFQAHRLTAYQFSEGYEPNLVVNHIDCDKLNNHYTNLEWVTVKTNTRHAYENNLIPIGEEHHKNVYSSDIIKLICERFEQGVRRKDVCAEVHKLIPTQTKNQVIDLLKRVKSRKTWKQISKDYSW